MPQIKGESASVNGSVPLSATESNSQQTNKSDEKCYEVSVVANVQLRLIGYAKVYAADLDEAVEKVQAQIDTKTLDDDFELVDPNSGNSMPYSDIYNVDFQTDYVEMIEDEIDQFDLLEADVEQLQVPMSWSTDVQANHKAFLESLLNEGGDEQPNDEHELRMSRFGPGQIVGAWIESAPCLVDQADNRLPYPDCNPAHSLTARQGFEIAPSHSAETVQNDFNESLPRGTWLVSG